MGLFRKLRCEKLCCKGKGGNEASCSEASDDESKHAHDSNTGKQRLNSGPSDKEKAIPVSICGKGEGQRVKFGLSDNEKAIPVTTIAQAMGLFRKLRREKLNCKRKGGSEASCSEASDDESKHAHDSNTGKQRLNSGPSNKEKAIPVSIWREGKEQRFKFGLSDKEKAIPATTIFIRHKQSQRFCKAMSRRSSQEALGSQTKDSSFVNSSKKSRGRQSRH